MDKDHSDYVKTRESLCQFIFLSTNIQMIFNAFCALSNIISQFSIKLPMFSGVNSDEYLLTVRDAIDADEGVYTIMIDGLGVEENFHVGYPYLLQYSTILSQVSLGSDAVSSPSSGCPSGERACLSGHCLPVSSFCNRHIECPDGDDELHCTRMFILFYFIFIMQIPFYISRLHAIMRPCNYVYLFISHRNVFISPSSLSSLPLISYPLLSNR